MTEREKVIVGLTDSIEILSDFDTQEYTIRERQQLHGSVIAAIQDALALLKAQEPVDAIVVSNGIDRSGGWWFQCPSCKMEIEPRDRYCRSCGQAVKW